MKALIKKLYACGVDIDKSITKSIRLPRPVVSVGNISVGGRGKTPFVIYLARWLKSVGYCPVVLTRGYGRRGKAPVWLNHSQIDTDFSGDEPAEIYYATHVPVLVGANRARNALEYLKYFQGRSWIEKIVFILDDGFQHWALQRDFDIVLIDPKDIEDELLPFGRLRETTEALKRANVVLTRTQDFVKQTIVRAEVNPELEFGVLTTRAVDKKYYEALHLRFKNLVKIKLPDHASRYRMLQAFVQNPGVNSWLLGAKEAVKILRGHDLLHEFFERGQVEWFWEGRKFDFYFVECQLDIQDVEEKIRKPILSIMNRNL